MRRDGRTTHHRSPARDPRGTGASGRRLRRFLTAAGPSLATVSGLVALAVVAPDAGFLSLLLVTAGGALALARADGDVSPSFRAVVGGGTHGPAGERGTAPQRAFVFRYLWGLVGFGAVALALTVAFLV
jgi:hypothetical protein